MVMLQHVQSLVDEEVKGIAVVPDFVVKIGSSFK
jgi:hypothetical protein